MDVDRLTPTIEAFRTALESPFSSGRICPDIECLGAKRLEAGAAWKVTSEREDVLSGSVKRTIGKISRKTRTVV
jgi:hypothetical protein